MKSKFVSWDKLLSYWIIIWFFVYFIASFFRKNNEIALYIYENTNPIFLFILAVLSSLKNVFLIIFYGNKNIISHLLIYILKFTIMKVLPLYYLFYQKIKVYENILFSLFIIILYLLYLSFMKEDIFDIYSNLEYQIIHNKCNTSLELFFKSFNSVVKESRV